MSGLDAQDEITALLRTIPNIDVHEGYTSDEAFAQLLANADSIRPFVTISYAGFIKPSDKVNGIVGAAYDSHIALATVRHIANSDRDARRLWQIVLDKLMGFVPTNCGELDAALFGGTGEIGILGTPTRHAAVQVYSFLVNSDKQ